MNVLITGGTGFIGSRLALRSAARGHSVAVLGQVNTEAERFNRRKLEEAHVGLVMGSVSEPDKIRMAMQGCDVVFHLAAAQHEANVLDQHFWDVNVAGTTNILEAAVETGVKRFVYGSTIGVYGSAMEGEIDENSMVRPDNIYGKTKLEAEKLVLACADKIPVVIVRISETYGPGDRRLLKLFKAIDKHLFFMIGDGENKHQLIFVDDLIDGLYRAAEKEQAVGELFTLAGREVVTTREMAVAIAAALNTRLPRWHAPLWPFMMAAIVMEKMLLPLGVQPPLHRRRMDFFRKSFYFSQEKAKKLLGFEPSVSFVDGIAETTKWYKANDYL